MFSMFFTVIIAVYGTSNNLQPVWKLTCHRHSLRQTERDRLPVCIMKLGHSLGVPVDLGQEHAAAGGATNWGELTPVLTSQQTRALKLHQKSEQMSRL